MQGCFNRENENVIDVKARHLLIAREYPPDLVVLNYNQLELLLMNVV